MARPSNQSKLNQMRQRLSESRAWRHSDDYESKWKRMVDLYRGKHLRAKSAEHRVVVNVAKSTVDVIVPSVSINNPRFNVKARKAEHAAQAVVTEEVINYLWRTYKYQRQFRLALVDSVIIGHGWVKVGYMAAKPPEMKQADKISEPTAENEGVADRDPDVEGNSETEKFTNWDDDRPFVERVSPWDIFVDPNARDVDDMRWIAQVVRRPVNDVKVDERYEKAVREKAQGHVRSRFGEGGQVDARDSGEAPASSETQYVDVVEFYDLKRKEWSTFLSDGPDVGDGFLRKPTKTPYPFGHPFVMIRNYEVIDHFYPMGELEAIEILQLELNETRTQMLNHRRKFQRKYMYHLNSFDEPAMKAMRSDNDNEMVPFDGDIDDMQKAVMAMPVQGTPPDFYNQSEMIQNDIDRVSGVSDYMRGDAANIRRTATEAAMIQDATNSRAAAKMAVVEEALAEIGEKLVQLMQMYMTGEHVIRVVGVNHPTWVQFDKDYIQGQFDFEVEAGSTQPRNESFRQQQALQLVDAMSPFGDIVDPARLAQHVLQAFGIKDPASFLAPQAPPEGPGGPPQGPEGAPMPPGAEGGMPPEMPGGMPPM